MIRDQALAVSGLLVEKIGGPSVKPYQPAGLWQVTATLIPSVTLTRKFLCSHEQAQTDAGLRPL